jgi:adenine phosphoribosyltransferase
MASPDPLLAAVRDVPDFPKPGIIFKDITPILADGKLLRLAMDRFVADCADVNVEKIAGIDARGFLFGATVADRLGLGFVPIRKRGKLPWKTESLSYKLEYGEAALEVHTDAFRPGERVVLIDDLLATGGTAAAAVKLIERCGGQVVQAQFLIELGFLAGRSVLAPTPVKALLTY